MLSRRGSGKHGENFVTEPDLQLLTGDGIFIDENGTKRGLHRVATLDPRELLFLDYHILQPSTFFRKEIYNEDSLNDKYVCAFDADFFIKAILNGVTYKKTDDLFAGFRIHPGIKTFSLAKKRYKESMMITRTYSDNLSYTLLAMLYRFFEIVFRPKFSNASRLFGFLLSPLRAVSYLLITGKPWR
jgi:hypothetical protein